jgi:hypothetical protein
MISKHGYAMPMEGICATYLPQLYGRHLTQLHGLPESKNSGTWLPILNEKKKSCPTSVKVQVKW